MENKTLGFIASLLLAGAPMGQAQTTNNSQQTLHNSHSLEMPGMDHNMSITDGSQSPEKIPDSTAYRLYFLTVSELPTASTDQLKRQHAYFSKIQGLSDNDPAALSLALATFKVNFNSMVQSYNASVLAASQSGSPMPDSHAFLEARDLLVQQTRDRLKAVLSPSGIAGLDAHVKFEKTRMRISTPSSQGVSQ